MGVSPGGRIPASVEAARDRLLRLAHPAGYWLGDIQTDVGPVAECLMMQAFLRQPRPEKIRKAANYIAGRQLSGGGWNLYDGGPVHLDTSVKAYFALKLAGWPADAPEMQRARQAVLALGGAEAAGAYTRFWLALFRQCEWCGVPAIPPEILFLPRFCYVSMYDVSALARTMLVPLSIIWAHRPRRAAPDGCSIDELFAGGAKTPRSVRLRRDPKWFSVRNLFLLGDGVLRSLDRLPVKPLRSLALRRAEKWMLERLQKSDGFGRSHPALMYSIMALDCLGYAPDHPILQYALGELYAVEVEEPDTLRFQPLQMPVSDTALACRALVESGLPVEHPAMARAAEWLHDHQTLRPGDWQQNNPAASPGGWYSEFDNEFYPSVDTTALVLLALNRCGGGVSPVSELRWNAPACMMPMSETIERGLAWLLSMQCSDGGFATFDRDNDHRLLAHSPLAGHNAMLDRSSADVTGRALEAAGALGRRKGNAAIDRAFAFLRQSQAPEGCWTGRWGVNGIYGTSCALRGLAAAGEDMRESYVVQAVEWLLASQNSDGGWGETCASYDNPDLRGGGPSTPTHTAWALMAFFAFGDFHSTSVRRGIEFLLGQQCGDGAWMQSGYTGTRFPGVFFFRNDLHQLCYPLLCLSEYARQAKLIPTGRAIAAGGTS